MIWLQDVATKTQRHQGSPGKPLCVPWCLRGFVAQHAVFAVDREKICAIQRCGTSQESFEQKRFAHHLQYPTHGTSCKSFEQNRYAPICGIERYGTSKDFRTQQASEPQSAFICALIRVNLRETLLYSFPNSPAKSPRNFSFPSCGISQKPSSLVLPCNALLSTRQCRFKAFRGCDA